MIIVSACSFGLSKINLIDYKTINNHILQKNIHHNYLLELPESPIYERPAKLSLIEKIYLVERKDPKQDTGPVIVADTREIAFEDIPKKIDEWQSERDEVDIPFMICQLYIHKTVKMDFVNQVKDQLLKAGVVRIAYAVIPQEPEYSDGVCQKGLYFSSRIQNPDSEAFDLNAKYGERIKHQNIIELRIADSDDCLVNDSLVSPELLRSTIGELIRTKSDLYLAGLVFVRPFP